MSQVLRFFAPMRSPIVLCAVLTLSVAAFAGSKKGSAQSSKIGIVEFFRAAAR